MTEWLRYETKRGDKLLKHINKALGIGLFVVVWQMISIASTSPAIPGAEEIFSRLGDILQDRKTIDHMIASMKIILMGISIAVLFGISVAIVMSMFEAVRLALSPLLESLRGVAALTLFPLLIATLGIGDISRVFVIFWTAWPSVLISTINGLDTERQLVEAAQSCGANKLQEFMYIRIPLAIPSMINGIRIGISGGFISLIAAEMLGATKGIGYMLLWASHAFDFKAVYAYIILIALISGLMNLAMLKIEKKVKEKLI